VVGIFLNRKNVIILLMAIELMLLAVNMNFIAFSHFLEDTGGPGLRVLHIDRRLRLNLRSGWRSWWCCSAM
jgi:NADH:ubiquinone oxidoreductase subunit K